MQREETPGLLWPCARTGGLAHTQGMTAAWSSAPAWPGAPHAAWHLHGASPATACSRSASVQLGTAPLPPPRPVAHASCRPSGVSGSWRPPGSWHPFIQHHTRTHLPPTSTAQQDSPRIKSAQPCHGPAPRGWICEAKVLPLPLRRSWALCSVPWGEGLGWVVSVVGHGKAPCHPYAQPRLFPTGLARDIMQKPRLGNKLESWPRFLQGGARQKHCVSNRMALCWPGHLQQATRQAKFILGCQRNQHGEKQRKALRPHPPSKPRRQSKEHPPNQSKGAKGRRKVPLTHGFIGCLVRASVVGGGGTSKRTGPGLSLFLVTMFCTSSRRSIMSQAGHSLVSVPPSLCPSVRPGRERKSVGLSWVCGLVSVSIQVGWLHFSCLLPAPLDEVFFFVVAAGLPALRIDDGSVCIRGII